MSVIVLLIFAGLTVATMFLACFIWAVCSGQYEDVSTPSMRILIDEAPQGGAGTTQPTKRDRIHS